MNYYEMTIGLNDRRTKSPKFTPAEAAEKLNAILLNKFEIYAYTLINCTGCYKHDNGEIVNEASIRIEIADEKNITKKVYSLIRALRHKECFNQESIMLKRSTETITF